MTPQVSVVSSGYNGEPYLDRAIPDADLEFILVDDGSSDRTLAKLRKLGERDWRVRVLAPVRMGAAAAYNCGVAQAGGDYIARQDFDDRSYPDRLRLQVAKLEWQVANFPEVLRDHGRRMRDTLRVPLPDRLEPMPARGSA